MAPAGLEEVRRAQEDGRWERAYAAQRTATVPDDLQRELDARPAAAAAFAALSARTATRSSTGSSRRAGPRRARAGLAEYVRMLEAGETLHPQAPRRRQRGGARLRPQAAALSAQRRRRARARTRTPPSSSVSVAQQPHVARVVLVQPPRRRRALPREAVDRAQHVARGEVEHRRVGCDGSGRAACTTS